MRKPKLWQKFTVLLAYLSYLCAMGAGLTATSRGAGSDDPIFASLLASVVFFLGVGIVLHVIGRANLPDLRLPK